MPSIGQENLERVMIDFFGALRRGDFEAAAELLDPEVSWQGLHEEWCGVRKVGSGGVAVFMDESAEAVAPLHAV